MKNILLISASPKKKGNSASIVNKLHACLNARVLFLCDYIILPCIDCGYCKIKTGECLQDSKEQNTAKTIFKEMQQADEIIFVSPIHFYHLPSQFKALLDRSQRYWHKGNNALSSERKIHAIFVAAREQGIKLTEGSLLTLKYFAPLIEAKIQSSLCLYGLDEKEDFVNSSQSQEKLSQYIQENFHDCVK